MGDSRSSSEEASSEREWMFYRDRPEWSDVTPEPQDDGPDPVVAIAYTDRFVDVYNYFRAVLKSEEKSERVLELTEDALDLNPANYTVWFYRREVLKALGADLKQELQFCREMIEEHPKNYQVWQHRRVLMEWINAPGNELRFTEVILSSDQKNYHVWQHRQWVLAAFNLWQGERDFIDRLLEEDIRNNSAWNQRFYVVSHEEGGWTGEGVVEREVEYTLDKINKCRGNESAWNYLRGVLEKCEEDSVRERLEGRVREDCERMLEQLGEAAPPTLLGFMVELLQQKLEVEASEEILTRVETLCQKLSTDCDKIRQRYWDHVRTNVRRKYAAA